MASTVRISPLLFRVFVSLGMPRLRRILPSTGRVDTESISLGGLEVARKGSAAQRGASLILAKAPSPEDVKDAREQICPEGGDYYRAYKGRGPEGGPRVVHAFREQHLA